ncbi:MAG TPA: tetratricopeptide repeat protein [Armatimonadetes bacterium]|nr:tetratricopeptide repeat protein [Armatimonadota bacterium]
MNLRHVLLLLGVALIVLSVAAGQPIVDDLVKTFLAARLVERAREHLIAREWDAAAQALSQAVHCRPEDKTFQLEVRTLLSEILVQQKRWQEGAKVLEGALQAGGEDNWIIRSRLAYCYAKLGRLAQAERLYQENLQKFPDNPEVYNELGYFYAERGIHLNKALALIQKALRQKPYAGHIVDSLGWVYYQKGRLEEAEQELERAATLTANQPNAEILYHLAVVYAARKKVEQAREKLQEALKLEPDYAEAQALWEQLR